MTDLQTNNHPSTDPAVLVTDFWDAMRLGDIAAIDETLADNVRWENVGLPTVHGRSAVLRALGLMDHSWVGFDVKIHRIASDGNTVMTERTDVITLGPLHLGFWVMGVFEVTPAGKISLWRDYADVANMTRGLIRGLLGIVFPGLRPRL